MCCPEKKEHIWAFLSAQMWSWIELSLSAALKTHEVWMAAGCGCYVVLFTVLHNVSFCRKLGHFVTQSTAIEAPPSALPASSSCTSLWSLPSSIVYGPSLLTLTKGPWFLRASAWRNFLASPTWSTRQMTGCGAWPNSLRACRNPFRQLSRDRNLHGLGMSYTMTASPKTSFRVPWRMGDAVVGGEYAKWTMPKHRCPLHMPELS